MNSSDRNLQKFLNEVPVLSRIPGINEDHYLRISVSVPGQSLDTLSTKYPAIEQLKTLYTTYDCNLDLEIFIRSLDNGNTKPMTLRQSYPE